VVYVDEDTGRITVEVLGRVTVDPDSVEIVSKFRRPKDTTPLRNKSA
jgi:hypothetical protein